MYIVLVKIGIWLLVIVWGGMPLRLSKVTTFLTVIQSFNYGLKGVMSKNDHTLNLTF